MQSVVGREKMLTLEPFWTEKNEFLRADDTTTDSSSESVTADAATVQPPVAALTQPPCSGVFTENRDHEGCKRGNSSFNKI